MRLLTLSFAVVCVLVFSGCRREKALAKDIERAYNEYYTAVANCNYKEYVAVTHKPLSESRFRKLAASVPRTNAHENPVWKVEVWPIPEEDENKKWSIRNKDSKVTGVSPWTAQEETFMIHKIGKKIQIVEKRKWYEVFW